MIPVAPRGLACSWCPSPHFDGLLPRRTETQTQPTSPCQGHIAAMILGHFQPVPTPGGEKVARLPVILAQLAVWRYEQKQDQSTLLVFPLDPWTLEDAETMVLRWVQAGFGVIPLPIAPVSHDFTPGPSPWGQSWRVPERDELLARAESLLTIHLEAMATRGTPLGSPPLTITWLPPEETRHLLEEPLRRLERVW